MNFRQGVCTSSVLLVVGAVRQTVVPLVLRFPRNLVTINEFLTRRYDGKVGLAVKDFNWAAQCGMFSILCRVTPLMALSHCMGLEQWVELGTMGYYYAERYLDLGLEWDQTHCLLLCQFRSLFPFPYSVNVPSVGFNGGEGTHAPLWAKICSFPCSFRAKLVK